MVWYLQFRHLEFINNIFDGNLRYSYIVVRWGKFWVVTASQGCRCCHIYSEMMFTSCYSGLLCLVGYHFL